MEERKYRVKMKDAYVGCKLSELNRELHQLFDTLLNKLRHEYSLL